MKVILNIVLFLVILLCLDCKSPMERKKEAARLDSLRKDSTRPVFNPYKQGQGTGMYNRERENLGNLDSLVTPQQPSVPRH